MESWRREFYHSAKGSVWSNHKYIAIQNGRYIYPEDIKDTKAANQIKRNMQYDAHAANINEIHMQIAELERLLDLKKKGEAVNLSDGEYNRIKLTAPAKEYDNGSSSGITAEELQARINKLKEYERNLVKERQDIERDRDIYEPNRHKFAHYGVSKLDGAKVGSGRYPLGSGEDPKALKERRLRTGLSVAGGLLGGFGGAALGAAAMVGVSAATGGTTFFMWPVIAAMSGTRIGALKGSEVADKLIEKNRNKKVEELLTEDQLIAKLSGSDTSSNELTPEQGWKKYYSDTDIHNPKTMYDFEAKAYYQLKEDGHTREKYKTEEEIRKAAKAISVDQFAKVAEKNLQKIKLGKM